MKEYLNSQEFYELMYSYRTAPQTDQLSVGKRFEDVKQAILSNTPVCVA